MYKQHSIGPWSVFVRTTLYFNNYRVGVNLLMQSFTPPILTSHSASPVDFVCCVGWASESAFKYGWL